MDRSPYLPTYTHPTPRTEDQLGFAEKPDYVEVKATVTWLKADPEPWYKSCTSADCKRKVTDQLGNYYCEKCQRSMTECAYRCVPRPPSPVPRVCLPLFLIFYLHVFAAQWFLVTCVPCLSAVSVSVSRALPALF